MSEHIKNYRKVAAMIKKWRRKELAECRVECKEVTEALTDPDPAHWDKDHIIYTCPKRVAHWGAGERVLAADLQRVQDWAKDYPKWVEKLTNEYTCRLEAADKAARVEEMTFSVTWKRNRTWGSNPRCTLWLSTGVDSFRAESGSIGGCGYDKLTAAMQAAMNKLSTKGLASIDRLVIEHGEKLWEEYAFDRHPFPHFSISGKGRSTFTSLFPRVGCRKYAKGYVLKEYVLDDDSRGDGYDYFHVMLRSKI